MDTATLQRVDGRDVLRFERRLAHPAGKVWRAITDPAEIVHWTTAEVDSGFAVGGPIAFRFDNSGTTHEGTVLAYDEPRLFEYTWEDDVLRWELTPDGDGCVLVFTQTFAGKPDQAMVAAGWHTHLEQLESMLDGTPIPWSDDRWIEHKQTYSALFELHGRITFVDRRPRIRFTRLLPYSQEAVFRAFSENDLLSQWFPATIEGERKAGARVEFHATDYEFPPSEGEVAVYDPPRRFEYTWGGERIRFDIWSFGDAGPFGGRLRFEFTDEHLDEFDGDGDALLAVIAAWHHGIERFEGVLAGEPIPISEARIAELLEEYRDRVEFPVGDRGLIRIVRRYGHPVERVWSALTESGETRVWLDPAEMEIGDKPGDTFEIVYRGYDEPPLPAEVRERARPTALSYTWGGDVVRWQLTPLRDGCRLEFTNDREHADIGCVLGWSSHHDILERLLDGDPKRRPDRPYGNQASLNGMPVFCFERRLAHPPAKVWRAITEPSELVKWFPAVIRTEDGAPLRADAELRFVFEEANVADTTGRVLEFDAPRTFAYEWNGDVHRWEVEPDGDGSRLWLATMEDSEHEQALKNATGWHTCVDFLEAALDEGPVPDPDQWKAHYMHYNQQAV